MRHSPHPFLLYFPALCSLCVFLFFFYAFVTLTPKSEDSPRSTAATAPYLPGRLLHPPLASPSHSPFKTLFPAQLALEIPSPSRPLLGLGVAAKLKQSFHQYQAGFFASVDPAWAPLMQRLERDGFNHADLRLIFSGLGPNSYSPGFMAAKITELFGVGAAFASPLFPAERFIPEGYKQPVETVNARNCLAFMAAHSEDFARAEKEFGVPAHIVMGILLIETELGTNLGKDSALRALAGMAATHSQDMLTANGATRQTRLINAANLNRVLKTKSDWAYKELVALLHYGLNGGVDKLPDLAAIPGSIYGAVGLCQFMPSNIPLFGVDGDEDGKIDLFTPVDALFSVANYLSANGWRQSLDRGGRVSVLLTYNRDLSYAHSVLAVAEQIRKYEAGKVSAESNPMHVVTHGGARNFDPSLRGRRPRYRLQPLDSYSSLLK